MHGVHKAPKHRKVLRVKGAFRVSNEGGYRVWLEKAITAFSFTCPVFDFRCRGWWVQQECLSRALATYHLPVTSPLASLTWLLSSCKYKGCSRLFSLAVNHQKCIIRDVSTDNQCEMTVLRVHCDSFTSWMRDWPLQKKDSIGHLVIKTTYGYMHN